MANNPKTYDCRVDLKNLFSTISDCRRAALRELPADFFVDFFKRIVTELKTSGDYRDICYQAVQEFRISRYSSNSKYRDIWKDATIDIFEQELEIKNIPNSHIISGVYEEYLHDNYYIASIFHRVGQRFNN